MGTPLLAYTEAYVTRLSIPSVGPEVETPFLLGLRMEPGSVDVGPFDSQQPVSEPTGELPAPSVQLSIGSLGLTVDALAIDSLVLIRPRGARLATENNPVLRIPASGTEAIFDAFNMGSRLSTISIDYQNGDSTNLLSITAEFARIRRLVPDYSGEGVLIELILDTPALTNY